MSEPRKIDFTDIEPVSHDADVNDAEVDVDGTRWALHYVTAREMYNVACAAMAGKTGSPADHVDFQLPPPPIAKA